jgi:hypothetical protein
MEFNWGYEDKYCLAREGSKPVSLSGLFPGYYQGKSKIMEGGSDCQGLRDLQRREGHPDLGNGKPGPHLFFG